MRRSRLTQTLHDYVAGDLDAAKRAAVEQRLASDPVAQALLEEIRDAHEALCVLRDRPAPPRLAEDALPHIHAAIAAEGFSRRPVLSLEGGGTRYYRRLALAATVLFAVTAGLFAYKFAGGDGAAPAEPAANIPTTQDVSAVDRGLEPYLLEAGSRPDGISAEELFEHLKRRHTPGAISDIHIMPVDNNVLPPVGNITEER